MTKENHSPITKVRYNILDEGVVPLAQKLTDEQIEIHLQQTNDWSRIDEKWLVKKYRFKHFMDGIQFVQKIAEFSEQVNHHPFIFIEYKVVTLKLTSWNAGGLTDLDFQCVKKYDEWYSQILR